MGSERVGNGLFVCCASQELRKAGIWEEWARSREAVVWEPTVQAWSEGLKTLANRPRPDTGGEGSGGTASLALAFASGRAEVTDAGGL